jgi:NAD(P)-dependent dehydrogenase (short-subunit alcohol dehydrogenase family)
MHLDGINAVVTGGASGLGLASTKHLLDRGATVTFLDLERSRGHEIAEQLSSAARFAAADVTDSEQVERALDAAETRGPIRALIHCAGRGGPLRLIDRDGAPADLATFEAVVRVNLVGSFNILRLVAVRMAKSEPLEGDRGVCVLTASVAAFEGQIGQIPYAASKAGVVGMTLVAARDLAQRQIRVCTIAPGIFDTPMLARVSDEVRAGLGHSVPHPSRLGLGEEFASLAGQIIENGMLNGETIRLDGALRMSPR